MSKPAACRRCASTLLALAVLLPAGLLRAQYLTPTNSHAGDAFGYRTAVSGDLGLVNAYYADTAPYTDSGELYLFRALDSTTTANTAVARLRPSSGYGNYLYFSSSIAASGTSALVGGSTGAYLFRGLDTATGIVNETATLSVPSANAAPADVPYAVALSGTTGLVGAYANNNWAGQVLVYHGLDTAAGTVSHSATLAPTVTLSTGDPFNSYPFGSTFGAAVSLSGGNAVVGAPTHNDSNGAAFLFRGVDTASGTVNQSAILTTATPQSGSSFGSAVSVSGNSALVSAPNATVSGASAAGLVYFYRNLDSASGTVTESAILSSSTPSSSLNFGTSIALSGDNALVSRTNASAAGLFTGLGTATGTITERLLIGLVYNTTISSVSLDGDRFILGAQGNNALAGYAASGSVSALTTLDTGNTSHLLNRYGVQMQYGDWIVGATTSHNSVTLVAAALANQIESQMSLNDPASAVYIGRDSGANDNLISLEADSNIYTHQIYVGSVAGNSGNTLRFEASSAGVSSIPTNHNLALYLAPANDLQLFGNYSTAGAFFGALQTSNRDIDLYGWTGASWNLVNAGNYGTYLTLSYDGTYTTATAVPEPSTYSALASLVALGAVFLRNRKRRRQ